MSHIDNLLRRWAEFLYQHGVGVGVVRGSVLGRAVSEGAAANSTYQSTVPTGVQSLSPAYLRVKSAIRVLPKPADHRLVLAAEMGLLDHCRGLRSQASRAAVLHISRTTYAGRLKAIRGALDLS